MTSTKKIKRAYIPIFRRRREGKTDFHRRKAVILSRRPFITVHISGKNILTQILKATPKGDIVIASSHSKELPKHGWKGSGKALPAAYLVGLVSGLRAAKKNIKDAILYTKTKSCIKGSRVTASVKGVIDAGINVPLSKNVLPSERNLKGDHISSYVRSLVQDNRSKYESKFSHLIRMGLKPEDYPKHFEEVKNSIKKEIGKESK